MKPNPIIPLFLLSAGLVFSAGALRADDAPAPTSPPAAPADQAAPTAAPADGTEAPTPPPHRRQRGYSVEQLTAKLGLTPDQQKTIGAVITDGQAQAKAARADDSLSDEDRRAKMMGIMKSVHDQIRADLTPDQQKIFDAMPRPGNRPPPPPQTN
jgi:hypothetical protein